ncbi:hypothetical protein DL769_002809 [Monosporascus sp. CRB-8-3]|nr:hypothetical protein DL769_002809 [Monosporascus sp. CRB-8-3]
MASSSQGVTLLDSSTAIQPSTSCQPVLATASPRNAIALDILKSRSSDLWSLLKLLLGISERLDSQTIPSATANIAPTSSFFPSSSKRKIPSGGREEFNSNKRSMKTPRKPNQVPGVLTNRTNSGAAFSNGATVKAFTPTELGYGEAGYAKDAGSGTIVGFLMKIPEPCGKSVTVLDDGAHHSAAVAADGQCLVLGHIDGGQLGIKFSGEQLEDDTLICLRSTAAVNIGKAAYVSRGTDHRMFINVEGKAFGAGFGLMGQLGTASRDDTEVAEEITRKALKGLLFQDPGSDSKREQLLYKRKRTVNSNLPLTKQRQNEDIVRLLRRGNAMRDLLGPGQ